MATTTVPADEIRLHPSSSDPRGRLFEWRGELYRAVDSTIADRYRRIISDGFVDELVRAGLLIDTEIAPLDLEGYELVLKHRRLPFVTFGREWSAEMLRAAASTLLKLERELARRHLSLQDGHTHNILFEATDPLFVDFTSIGLLPRDRPWSGLSEFYRTVLIPLELMAAGHRDIGRALLFHIGADPSRYDAPMREITGADSQLPEFEAFADRVSFVDALISRVDALDIVEEQTHWSDYYGESFLPSTPTPEWQPKQHTVRRILTEHRPGTVLDVGTNRGWYALLAARQGSKVVAFDVDETCIDQLYRETKDEALDVLPLVMSLSEAAPGDHLGIHPPAADRLRCDLVLALALVHHLVFKGRLSFDHIAYGLAAFTDRWLAVEFVPREDRHVREWWTHHEDWYTLENFKASLGRHFRSITELPSTPEPRVILLCER